MDYSTVKRKTWIFPYALPFLGFAAKVQQQIQEVALRSQNTIVICALLLGGCASTQAILDGAPDEVATSAKSAEAVAFCIGEKNMAAPFRREDGSYVISIKSAVGMTGIVYTVIPDVDGSRLEVRRANSPVSVTKFRNCL